MLECEPPSDGAARYRVTWEMMGAVSWLEVALTADGDRTRVRMEHLARVADVPDGMWETYGPGATGVGWDGGLLGLSLHLGAVDGSLAPQDAQAWAATDEGHAFYRATADAWGRAHEASGVDRATAQAGADETYRFYTGTA